MTRREPTAALRDDGGVIAIIVALSISTFLLGFAALAVDLGMAYERQSQLQSVADRLALAGASGLPSINDALTDVQNALDDLCQNDSDAKTTPGICPAPNDWASDGQTDNGEVTFYQDTGQTSLFSTGADGQPVAVGQGADQAEGIKVALPPSKVDFGFAGAFSSGSADVSKSATARIGTPLGAGILPFALTQNDLDQGQWCVKTGVTGGQTPKPNPGLIKLTPDNPDVDANTAGQQIDFTIWATGLTHVRFHSENSGQKLPATFKSQDLVSTTYTVTIPSDAPGAQPALWATGTIKFLFFPPQPFTSQLAYLNYTGITPPNADPCAGTNVYAALRGFSRLARSSDNPGSNDLTSNIRTGPQVRLYPDGGLVNSLGTLLDCVSTTFSPATTCLSNQVGQNFAQDMTDGLFDSAGNAPGRLDQSCDGAGTQGVTGQNGKNADGSQLLSGYDPPATSLVNRSEISPQDLLSWIVNHKPVTDDQNGWISSRALRCGRLAVMPVINPVSINGVVGGQTIVSFTYVWIDDIADNGKPAGNRGVNWVGNQVGSLQGYVINPDFLPREVAGSLVVGPYLGANMPKEAVLVHDLGAPDT